MSYEGLLCLMIKQADYDRIDREEASSFIEGFFEKFASYKDLYFIKTAILDELADLKAEYNSLNSSGARAGSFSSEASTRMQQIAARLKELKAGGRVGPPPGVRPPPPNQGVRPQSQPNPGVRPQPGAGVRPPPPPPPNSGVRPQPGAGVRPPPSGPQPNAPNPNNAGSPPPKPAGPGGPPPSGTTPPRPTGPGAATAATAAEAGQGASTFSKVRAAVNSAPAKAVGAVSNVASKIPGAATVARVAAPIAGAAAKVAPVLMAADAAKGVYDVGFGNSNEEYATNALDKNYGVGDVVNTGILSPGEAIRRSGAVGRLALDADTWKGLGGNLRNPNATSANLEEYLKNNPSLNPETVRGFYAKTGLLPGEKPPAAQPGAVSAGPGKPPAAQPVATSSSYQNVDPKLRSKFDTVGKWNKGMGQWFQEGTYDPVEGKNSKFTPSQQWLGQVGTDTNLQDALVAQNSGDQAALWNHMAGQQGVKYDEFQYLPYKQQQLQKQLNDLGFKGMDMMDPAVQAKLKGYSTIESDLKKNMGDPTSQNVGLTHPINSFNAWMGGMSEPDSKAPLTTQYDQLIKNFNYMTQNKDQYTPEQLEGTRSAINRLKELNDVQNKSGIPTEEFKKRLTDWGTQATQLGDVANSADPAKLRSMIEANKGAEDPEFKKYLGQASDLGVDINTDAISEKIPLSNKIMSYMKQNPWKSLGIAGGGVGLLTLLGHLLGGGGQQQQAPQQQMMYPPEMYQPRQRSMYNRQDIA